MQITIYKKKNEPFDLIAADRYMFVGFHDLATPIDLSPVRIGPYNWTTGPDAPRIRQIGMRKPGFNSAGASVLEMIPPAFLSFAGSFQPADDPGVPFLLFDSYIEDGRKQFAGESELPGYAKSYVAFYDLGAHLMIITRSQSSRILSKDFRFASLND